MSKHWFKLRWVILVPSLVASAIAIRMSILTVGKATLWLYLGPMHILSRLFVECLALTLTGAGVVLIGTLLAPTHRRLVSAIVTLAVVLFGAWIGLITYREGDNWAVASCIGLMVGSASAWCFLAGRAGGLKRGFDFPLRTVR